MGNLFSNKKIPKETDRILENKSKKLKRKYVRVLRPVFISCMKSVFDRKKAVSGSKWTIPFPVKPLMDLELIILCNGGRIHINNNICKGKLRVRDVILELCNKQKLILKGLSIQINKSKKDHMNIYVEV